MTLARRWQEAAAPSTEPITLAAAKSHLRVEVADDDSLITNLITAARVYLERRTGYWMASRAAVMELNGFPPRGGDIVFPIRPVTSVSQMQYLPDGASALSTMTAGTDYRLVNTGTLTHRIRLPYGVSEWPKSGLASDAVRVSFVCGAASAEANMNQAMLLLIGHWYENRETAVVGSISSQVSFTIESLAGMSAVGDLDL